nr:immunoglobulin heavy chain junction region [Mus musculus]NSM06252.1 immunoglobulin heavy chain junction region [Mus musculus]NSM07983.1 immunoglobulin heavy chain junction region [Mus musculus]NSM09140.1 immunoglobulin heavy chain junction region [Mus musculus]
CASRGWGGYFDYW